MELEKINTLIVGAGLTIYLLIINLLMTKPLFVVARDGIEPQTQVFSGLGLR
jgi:hypothetical protein